jgi:hypothetical protein
MINKKRCFYCGRRLGEGDILITPDRQEKCELRQTCSVCFQINAIEVNLKLLRVFVCRNNGEKEGKEDGAQ